MSQDDGSDSEPELVVQPRGHWDKSLTVRIPLLIASVSSVRAGGFHLSRGV